MDIESELTLSYYKEIADINRDHGVFLVQHTENKRIYVKKVMSVYNAKVFRHLKMHPLPGLPTICELVESDGTLTVIEDYITGETLEDILTRRGKLPQDEVISIMSQLCDTVDTLHSFKPPVIHRDIKPSNVIITPDGSAVLLDMNAARFDEGASEEDTTLLGTKGFAAPEQYGFGTSGVTTDIYALGMLMNTMLTGTVSRENIASGPLSSVIKRCLELDPANRYSSAYKLKHALYGRKAWSKYLPPGFRSGNFLHMFPAIIMYAAMGITTAGVFSGPGTIAVRGSETLGFIAMFALIVAFSFNYHDLRRRVAPFLYRYNPVARAFFILLFDVVIVIACLLVIVITGILVAVAVNDPAFIK